MEIILNGILYGVVLAFLIGPVFFTILQTSIERGFLCGVSVAIGVSLSDALYISIAYIGLSKIVDNPDFRTYLAYGGGIILMGFGLYNLLIKSKKLLYAADQHPIRTRSTFRYIAKGFIINGLSPMVLIFWIGTIGVATAKLGYTSAPEASLFFISIILTVFTTDVIKAKLAAKLRRILTPRFIRVMNIVLGIALVIFGGRLIVMADELPVF